MTLWEFDCCVRGWLKAYGPKEKLKAPVAEFAAAMGIKFNGARA
jgi:hypothetical protein